MIKKLKDTIDKFSMLKKDDTVLVAVSGGPDSVCLLSALDSLKNKLGIKLYAAHLNHCLRGAESDKDELYVKRLTHKLNIPLFTESKDINKFAREKGFSTEQAARELRYDFLMKTAKTINANKIATAHTKDDQAETLLMRLLKGSGLRGLCGIPVKRKISGNILIIRPLMETSKREIFSFLKKKKIKPRRDSSNLKDIYFRNKIRNNLLPYIEKNFSPNIKDILAKIADNIETDYEYLLKRQRGIFNKIAGKISNKISLPLVKFISQPQSPQRGIVRLAIEAIKGDLNKIDYRHWGEIQDLILKRKTNSQVHLPGKIIVVKKEKTIDFEKKGSTPLRESTFFFPIKVKTSISKIKPKKLGVSKKIEYFDADKIKFPIKMRFRKGGDKIKPLGMKHYKRLQDIFVDDKIKAEKRDKIPILVDAKNRIIWVCGVRMSDDFKIAPSTKRYLKLESP